MLSVFDGFQVPVFAVSNDVERALYGGNYSNFFCTKFLLASTVMWITFEQVLDFLIEQRGALYIPHVNMWEI